jgi:thermopsin
MSGEGLLVGRALLLVGIGFLLFASGLALPAGVHPATLGAPLGADPDRGTSALSPHTASPHRAVSAVDPFALLSTEPAPMGIADFGVNGVGGVVQPYSYATPEFQANVQIDSLYMSGGGAHDMTFQLNTVLVLEDGARNYSYWIQDVAEIDTTYNGIYWADNIWNLSGASQATNPLSPSELRGNGSVNDYYGLDWYAVAVGSGLPGTGIDLAYPTNITVREVASTIDGLPQVGFMYDDGYGWVTFDNVTFLHAANWKSVGFVVDGYQYTPMGVFYDAEWDYSGNHQGQHNIDCDLNMTLEYWNGHNLESPPSAWNFGGDTAESVDNVVAGLGSRSSGGLESQLTTGAGNLGLLYNGADVAVANLSIPTLENGTVVANGASYPYRGGDANLTLAPGRYELELYNGSTLVDAGNVTFAAGSYNALPLPFPKRPISFHEAGLAAGTRWSVALPWIDANSTTPWINVSQQDGLYNYSIDPVAGYVDHARAGRLNVSGEPLGVDVNFWTFNYTVSFVEYGLPSTASWWVEFQGAETLVTGSTATFQSPNGTFNYSITTVNLYVGAPTGGVVNVTGGPALVATTFSIHLGWIQGSVDPGTATVTIDGSVTAVTDGAFNLSVAPGSYEIVSTQSGYVTEWLNVTVTPGNATPALLHLAPIASSGSPSTPSTGGLVPTTWVIALGAAVVVVVLALGLLVLRRRR